MIPKVIHYCWFGKNPKPDDIVKCIESWTKYLPEWKVIEWNEENYDVNKNNYIKDAYEEKKWAFVSDFARLDILYEYGGVYLDVDVEFIKKLPEEYLEYEGFCGFECTGIVAPGLIFGVEKKNEMIKEIIDSYSNERFLYEKSGIYKTINLRVTEMLKKKGLKTNNEAQIVEGIHIFPSEYFCGYDTDVREPDITENTICWHHYLGSWSNPSLKTKMQNVVKKIIGVKAYRRLLQFVRNIRKRWRKK